MQLRQQRQPVVTQLRIVRIDHHLLEKQVYAGAQAGQARQRRLEIAGRKGAIDGRRAVEHGGMQGLLLRRTLGLQDSSVDRSRHCLGFLQDVGDALVGSSQRAALR